MVIRVLADGWTAVNDRLLSETVEVETAIQHVHIDKYSAYSYG